MLSVQADTRNLESALAEFARVAKKDLAEVVKKEGASFVGHIIALTPPGSMRADSAGETKGITLDAKKRGEANVAADIAKIFPTSSLPEKKLRAMVAAGFEFRVGRGHKSIVREFIKTPEELRQVHEHARNRRTGRTRKVGGAMMAITRKAVLRRYIKQEQQKVGMLGAGWVPAARELKTTTRATPAWITRHAGSKGGADWLRKEKTIGVRIFNNQQWFPHDMKPRVERALRRTERGLMKAVEVMLERRAARAQARMDS